MTQKEYKEKIIDKFVLKKYETNQYVQGRHLLYQIKPKNTEYKYIDLGLPSGTLWATMNVGAKNIYDVGLGFSWGDTVGYEDKGPSFNYYPQGWKDYKFSTNSTGYLTPNLNKYCYNSNYGYEGYTDDLLILEDEDDAAHVFWGNDWIMPTANQFYELVEYTTASKLSDRNGVRGVILTSTINGNEIIFPNGFEWQNSITYLWAKDLDPGVGYPQIANAAYYGDEDDFAYLGVNGNYSGTRCELACIRPVQNRAKIKETEMFDYIKAQIIANAGTLHMFDDDILTQYDYSPENGRDAYLDSTSWKFLNILLQTSQSIECTSLRIIKTDRGDNLAGDEIIDCVDDLFYYHIMKRNNQISVSTMKNIIA